MAVSGASTAGASAGAGLCSYGGTSGKKSGSNHLAKQISCGNTRVDFKVGDIIRYDGVFSHFAVVVDAGKAVGYDGKVVAEETITEGAVLHKRPSAADRFQVAQRAECNLGEGGYHVLFNNCKSFAHWCFVGGDRADGISRQAAVVSSTFGACLTGGGTTAALIAVGDVAVVSTQVASAGIMGLLGFRNCFCRSRSCDWSRNPGHWRPFVRRCWSVFCL